MMKFVTTLGGWYPPRVPVYLVTVVLLASCSPLKKIRCKTPPPHTQLNGVYSTKKAPLIKIVGNEGTYGKSSPDSFELTSLTKKQVLIVSRQDSVYLKGHFCKKGKEFRFREVILKNHLLLFFSFSNKRNCLSLDEKNNLKLDQNGWTILTLLCFPIMGAEGCSEYTFRRLQ